MEPEKTSPASAAGAVFNAVERLVLFALSAAVGLVNLLIGLAVAAHLGVLPKSTSARILRATSRATGALTRVMAAPGAPQADPNPGRRAGKRVQP
ncbi:MAG TPA: hypothetical protein VN915_06545 [Elusimicrobiota bacterium]|nr:hypothetical protein [Elusimicrobiota bacterium]